MDHGEVVRLQLRVPPGLSSVEVLRLPEVRQVPVICPDLELVLHAEEVWSPLLESNHDREHLAIVNLVVAFRRRQRFRSICDRVPLVVDLLRQHSSHCVLRAVRFHTERCVISWNA